jgi:hypothetical protein
VAGDSGNPLKSVVGAFEGAEFIPDYPHTG